MPTIHIESSKVINASQEAIWSVIADYEVAHKAILPKPQFEKLIVESGGYGAGTEMTVRMNAMGTKRQFRLVASEPEPGRILAETDQAAGTITTFTLNPLPNGKQTEVIIATDMPIRNGITGYMERLLTVPFIRRMYTKELALLEAYLAKNPERQTATQNA